MAKSSKNTNNRSGRLIAGKSGVDGQGSNTPAGFSNREDRSTLYGNSTASPDCSTPNEDSESSQRALTRRRARKPKENTTKLPRLQSPGENFSFMGSEFPTTENPAYPQFLTVGSDGRSEFNGVAAQETTLPGSGLQLPESYYNIEDFTPLQRYYVIPQRHEEFAVRHESQPFDRN